MLIGTAAGQAASPEGHLPQAGGSWGSSLAHFRSGARSPKRERGLNPAGAYQPERRLGYSVGYPPIRMFPRAPRTAQPPEGSGGRRSIR